MTNMPIYLVFLGCTSFAFTASAAQQPSHVPEWRQSQEANTADAYTYTRFTLLGRYTAGNIQSADRPKLVIDCMPRAGSYISSQAYLGAKLRTGIPLKIVYVEPEEAHGNWYVPKVAVKYSGDGVGVAEGDNWMSGDDKTSVSVPRSALKSFLQERVVAIQAQDNHGTPLAMRFDIPDPTPVADDCKLDLR